MAIEIRCFSFVLRIDAIRDRYDGGWIAFLAEHEHLLGCGAWHDAHLFCVSVMDGSILPLMIRQMSKKGLVMTKREGGQATAWLDGFIIDGRRLTLPCDWLEFEGRRAIFLRGTEPGNIVSMRTFGGQPEPDVNAS